jgi:LPPG:FO 2-phospho-L-lactate transferase
MSFRSSEGRVVALCGGIGGAKLALGLYRTLPPGKLSVIVNGGDDFEHLGLKICPDLDTVLYTLAGLADPVRGWGRADETWQFMATVAQIGGETWFQLGDRDLAMHVLRTDWLRTGNSLSAFAAHTARQFGIGAQILPMTDASVQTVVETGEGDLPFQHYFVRRRCEPAVRGIRFSGAHEAKPAAGVAELFADADLRCIIICPSNPYLSIDPILAVPGIVSALALSQVPVIAVSPIIGGKAVKGPTAKIMNELGVAVTTQTIARHYHGLIDGLVIDVSDRGDRDNVDLPVLVTQTMMNDLADRERLAADVVAFADELTPHAAAKVGKAARR